MLIDVCVCGSVDLHLYHVLLQQSWVCSLRLPRGQQRVGVFVMAPRGLVRTRPQPVLSLVTLTRYAALVAA